MDNPAPIRYTTLAAPSTADTRDRGSRFLAFSFPVRSTDDIKPRLKALRAEHPKATHHCYAWRLGTDGTQWRAVDDGEPAGSAGRPILAAIDSAGVTDTLVVVVRYFGGTLLGVPGLIAAYRGCAAEALASAPKEEQWVSTVLRVECDYAALGEVLRILKGAEGKVLRQEQGLFCVVDVSVPQHHTTGLRACLGAMRDVRVTATQ